LQPPRYIGLAGLGFLGRGIAACLLDHGFHVVAIEPNAAAWQTVPASEHLIRADSPKDLAHCELIIESIIESFPAKQALFVELEQHVAATVPIASNTSSIPITLLQAKRNHPHRFAGMHWCAPAEATRFMEIIRGDQTDDATLDSIAALAKELGKAGAIVQKDIAGFVANRIAYAMYREALHLLEEGVADAATIDLLCRHSLGLWTPICGPFRWIDISGGPALYATAMERIVPTLNNESEVPKTMRRMQQNDDRGTQNGRGFYTYGPGDSDEWQRRLREHALRTWALGEDDPNR
jgi:3-hydroxybutyryl-CoA dehydrogenase